jgi:hypothetical protein
MAKRAGFRHCNIENYHSIAGSFTEHAFETFFAEFDSFLIGN